MSPTAVSFPSVHGGVSRIDYQLLGRVIRARIDAGDVVK